MLGIAVNFEKQLEQKNKKITAGTTAYGEGLSILVHLREVTTGQMLNSIGESAVNDERISNCCSTQITLKLIYYLMLNRENIRRIPMT